MRCLGRAVAVFALLGTTAAWGQEAPQNSPSVSTGWQRVEAAGAVGGACFMAKNRLRATSETATWGLPVPAVGDYQIQVYVPPVDSLGPRTQNATYIIRRAAGVLPEHPRVGAGLRLAAPFQRPCDPGHGASGAGSDRIVLVLDPARPEPDPGGLYVPVPSRRGADRGARRRRDGLRHHRDYPRRRPAAERAGFLWTAVVPVRFERAYGGLGRRQA